jgi:hypothetical protein
MLSGELAFSFAFWFDGMLLLMVIYDRNKRKKVPPGCSSILFILFARHLADTFAGPNSAREQFDHCRQCRTR